VAELGVETVHAFAHITGGGLAGNTARVIPEGLVAVVDRGTWALPPAVRLLEEHGVPREESERAFNCGVGMIAAVSAPVADRVVDQLLGAGITAWVAGAVEARTDDEAPAAALVGAYR
jgi:phosphoribosylformylglycinamidine cyclo-ligase